MSGLRSRRLDGGAAYRRQQQQFLKGEPTLLSFDDVKTLFHEFGHGLHGLLSRVRRALAGTSVRRDFVEFPSQIFENWALEPENWRRKAPSRPASRSRRSCSNGYSRAQLQPGFCHGRIHGLRADGPRPASCAARRRTARFEAGRRFSRHAGGHWPAPPPSHFQHLFAGGYAAGYYVYMWAEVLDADGYAVFAEAGDPFNPAGGDGSRQSTAPAGPENPMTPTAPSGEGCGGQARCSRNADCFSATAAERSSPAYLRLSLPRSRQRSQDRFSAMGLAP